MDNKIVVRTDIINPHTYLDLELDYKDLIETIFLCGGYALYYQLYKYYGEKSKGYREIKKMEDILLIGSEQLNNNYYIYLKSTSLKYLKYRKIETIETDLTVNRLNKNPSYRPLMNSIYSFEYLLERHDLINVDLSLEKLDIFLKDVIKSFELNRLQNIHLGNVAKENYREQLKVKLKILGDRSSIYLKDYIRENSLKDSTLHFVWYDFDQEIQQNPIFRVLTLISKFLNFVGTKNQLNCCEFTLEIITISEERKSILEKLTKRALERVNKKNNYYLNNSINTKSNKVISHIREVNYDVLPDIEKYIKVSVRGDNEFNFADIKTVERIEKLKEVIKKNKER
ncbi:hypothetical protein [Senegalia massiliensis]|uniref:hypothetical protein n=1 Tax=Senegalia massiliensis TaxID=1720316 RepID=UPI00102F9554|nr:hypothetical protein [Senegalia massiliensis]